MYTLAAANNMLFSGGHDQSIRVWQFNQPAGLFEAAVGFGSPIAAPQLCTAAR